MKKQNDNLRKDMEKRLAEIDHWMKTRTSYKGMTKEWMREEISIRLSDYGVDATFTGRETKAELWSTLRTLEVSERDSLER